MLRSLSRCGKRDSSHLQTSFSASCRWRCSFPGLHRLDNELSVGLGWVNCSAGWSRRAVLCEIVFPLMWSRIVDSLLGVLNGMDIKPVGYADDIAIQAEGAYEEILRNLVKETLKVIEAWCRFQLLHIYRDKTEEPISNRQSSVTRRWGYKIYRSFSVLRR